MSLNVMVLESTPNAAADAVQELRDAGHTVLSCHEPGAPAFPCRGLINRADCPLSSRVVDVALVVRPIMRAQPTAREDGARCALMRRVPLVVAGSPVLSPYDELVARSIDRTHDVVETCEAAASAPIASLGERARVALSGLLGPDRASAVRPSVEVHRVEGRLRASVTCGGEMTKNERARVAVAILAALRDLDPFATGVDVMIDGARQEDS